MFTGHRPIVLLFDIDGTLLSTGGIGRVAVEATLKDHFGMSGLADFGFGGMTDQGIFRQALNTYKAHPQRPETAAGSVLSHDMAPLGDEASLIHALIDRYVGHLEGNMKQLVAPDRTESGLVVHPGVREILDKVRNKPGVAVGLGTGNVERGARIKLQPTGLNPHFAFGGFGCDAELRADLIAAGAQRGAQQLGHAVDECRVVVIGDTPKDVSAAHTIGAECVAVATGYSSLDELDACAPEVTIADLTAPGLADFLLG